MEVGGAEYNEMVRAYFHHPHSYHKLLFISRWLWFQGSFSAGSVVVGHCLAISYQMYCLLFILSFESICSFMNEMTCKASSLNN